MRQALASAGEGLFRDSRAYWFAGKYLADFVSRLESHGFYLVDKNKTPAKHLDISRASVSSSWALWRSCGGW